MRMSAQARTTLMLLGGSQDLSRQQVFPRLVNLMEMESKGEMGEEREDRDGGKGRYKLDRKKGGRWEKGSLGTMKEKSYIFHKQAILSTQNRRRMVRVWPSL